jgi:hypothetical protein
LVRIRIPGSVGNCPEAHHVCYLQALFHSAQHIYEKREGSGAWSISLQWIRIWEA